MQTLMQQYTNYIASLKADGVKFLAFDCPKCAGSIETQQPPEGDVWDTLSTCPHCEAMFFKIATHQKAFGRVPD